MRGVGRERAPVDGDGVALGIGLRPGLAPDLAVDPRRGRRRGAPQRRGATSGPLWARILLMRIGGSGDVPRLRGALRRPSRCGSPGWRRASRRWPRGSTMTGRSSPTRFDRPRAPARAARSARRGVVDSSPLGGGRGGVSRHGWDRLAGSGASPSADCGLRRRGARGSRRMISSPSTFGRSPRSRRPNATRNSRVVS